MIVISDTTPLISLIKINHLELIGDLFGEIQIPDAVYRELVSNKKYTAEADKIKNYKSIKRVKVENETSVQLLRRATGLDIGESEAIILSDQIKADLLLMDEVKGRQVARNMGINLMGTIGILMQAYDSRLLSKEEIEECIEILRILDIEDVYNMDELKVGVTNFITFTDKDGNVKDNQPAAIDFYSNMKIDSKYESDGHPPQICISINSQGKLETLRYTYYEVKKINKEYEFKTFDEIRADIQNENNVVVDFVYGEPIEGGVENWQDITINDIEVVMDCPSDNKNFNNIVPYYVMTGYNKRNDEITITMPAIKNKYLYVTEGLKEDMKRIAKKILGRD